MAWTCDEDGRSDPAKKDLCTKPGGSGDRTSGRTKLMWCKQLEEYIAWVWCRNVIINAQSKDMKQTSRQKSHKLTEKVKSHPGM